MIESDTIKLLRECDAGVKMGISSIEDAENFINIGATRLGTSRIVKIVKAMEKGEQNDKQDTSY